MDTLNCYREIIEQTLAQHATASGNGVQHQTVFDRENHHYLVVNVGWGKHERVYGVVAHIDLIDDKAWVQYDGTEEGVANQLRDEGLAIRDAIVESASVRLRPILMTSIATIMGAVPLVAAGGPGSASRATIGVVVIFGVAFSTLLSLYVVPSFYALLAPYTRSPEALARKLDKLEEDTPEVAGGVSAGLPH